MGEIGTSNRQRRCSVCGALTSLACVDCTIDFSVIVYVCWSPACRDAHEVREGEISCAGPDCGHPRRNHRDPSKPTRPNWGTRCNAAIGNPRTDDVGCGCPAFKAPSEEVAGEVLVPWRPAEKR